MRKSRDVLKLVNAESKDKVLTIGKYKGWKLRNVPVEYLEWVLRDVTTMEFRDLAEIELFRRKHSGGLRRRRRLRA